MLVNLWSDVYLVVSTLDADELLESVHGFDQIALRRHDRFDVLLVSFVVDAHCAWARGGGFTPSLQRLSMRTKLMPHIQSLGAIASGE